MDPLVTVITLSFISGERIQNTLNTIRGQTYLNIEHIIIDDASTDNSVAIINDWIANYKYHCLFIVHSQNKGICASLNEALKIANGEFIAIIGDDEMLPDKILHDVQFMQSNPDIGFCHSNALVYFEKTGKEILLRGKHSDNIFHDFFAWNLTIYSPTIFYRKKVFDEVGDYDESLIFEDFDMILRMAYKFKGAYRDETTIRYIKTRTGISIERTNELVKQSMTVIQKWRFLKKYNYYLTRRHLCLFYGLVENNKIKSLKYIPRAIRCITDKRLYGAFYRLFFKWK